MMTPHGIASTAERPTVVLLPGGNSPANLSYGPLLAVLGQEIPPPSQGPGGLRRGDTATGLWPRVGGRGRPARYR